MDLSDLIKKAAQQQTGRNTQNTECIKLRVDLGVGRKSCYGYNRDGRPTNEGYEGVESDGQIFNE